MTKAKLGWVTNHMGQTKNVNFAWYRKEYSTIELTKMAKVLMAVQVQGGIDPFPITIRPGGTGLAAVLPEKTDPFRCNVNEVPSTRIFSFII